MEVNYTIEDLFFQNIGTAVKTGRLIQLRSGRMVEKTKYQEFYKTSIGTFLPQKWHAMAMAAVEAAGEIPLLEAVKDHCRKNCAWLRTEDEIEEYALDCMTHKAYLHWEDFQTEEKGIFFVG